MGSLPGVQCGSSESASALPPSWVSAPMVVWQGPGGPAWDPKICCLQASFCGVERVDTGVVSRSSVFAEPMVQPREQLLGVPSSIPAGPVSVQMVSPTVSGQEVGTPVLRPCVVGLRTGRLTPCDRGSLFPILGLLPCPVAKMSADGGLREWIAGLKGSRQQHRECRAMGSPF